MKRRTVTLRWLSGRPFRTPALVFGVWAVHLAPHLDGYRVTHIPTGCTLALLVDGVSEEDAIRVADRLHRRIPRRMLRGIKPPSIPDHVRGCLQATVAEAFDEEIPSVSERQ